ncbi:glycoside hydrolase family 16 protein [uncultured Dokdonia sp.]|uniref:glycoside hydrolase family 16 protein n=1 Tax=uncultured Dokdonia sp. TaxID=575653 RepID=UPI0026237C1F|nr:glycoside hydrolase family 16 protein [uncultured Dokdonia sp.]
MKTFLLLILCSCCIVSCSDTDNTTSVEPEVSMEDPMNDEESNDDSSDVTILPDVSNVGGVDQQVEDLPDWDLVWEEQFDTNLTAWTAWDSGAFNNEFQKYTPSNVVLENGYLYLQEKRETVTGFTNPFDPTIETFEFTSGRIETNETYSPENLEEGTKLRMSARILLPEGDGLWPAFWSFSDPWPTNGEIDVMEYRGNNTQQYSTNFFYGSTEGQPDTDPGQTTTFINSGGNITTEFHVFEVIWSENELEIFFDSELVHTFTEAEWGLVDDFYNRFQRITLNMAVGGDFFSDNLNPDNIPDEAFTVVDWVRVYKQ